MSNDKYCRICMETINARRYRNLYHEGVVPLHSDIRLIVGQFCKDDGQTRLVCYRCYSILKKLESARNKISQIKTNMERYLYALKTLWKLARQTPSEDKISYPSETINSDGREDVLPPGKQYIVLHPMNTKTEPDLCDDCDSVSSSARRWVVAGDGVLRELPSFVKSIKLPVKTIAAPTKSDRLCEVPAITSVAGETGRTEEIGTTHEGNTSVLTKRWCCVNGSDTDSTGEVGTAHGRIINIVPTEQCCDVVRTEINGIDISTEIGTPQGGLADITPTEQWCRIMSTGVSGTDSAGEIGTPQERLNDVVPVKQCCSIMKTEVSGTDNTEVQQGITNVVPMEQYSGVVKTEFSGIYDTEVFNTLQEGLTSVVPKNQCCGVLKTKVSGISNIEVFGAVQDGITNVVPMGQCHGVMKTSVTGISDFEGRVTSQEGFCNIIPQEQCGGVVKTGIIGIESTEETETSIEGIRSIFPVEQCRAVVMSGVGGIDSIAYTGTSLRRITNVVSTEQCYSVTATEVERMYMRDEMCGVTTTTVAMEECHDTAIKSEPIKADSTDDVDAVQESSADTVPVKERRAAVDDSETGMQSLDVDATDTTHSTAALQTQSVEIRPKKGPLEKRCSVCLKTFGRLLCLKAHERLHRKLKSYSRCVTVVERDHS